MPTDSSSELNELNKGIATLDSKITIARARLKLYDSKLQFEMRAKGEKAEELQLQYQKTARELREFSQKRANLVEKARIAIERLEGVLPRDIVNGFSDKIPILLFPVRLETRFKPETKQLLVRIYPDDISIESHEPLLTQEEYEAGCQYFMEKWKAERTPGGEDPKKLEVAAWCRIGERYGSNRAAWIVRAVGTKYIETWPERDGETGEPSFRKLEDTLSNTYDAETASINELNAGKIPADWKLVSLREPYRIETLKNEEWQILDEDDLATYKIKKQEAKLNVTLKGVPLRPDAWSQPLVCRLMPYRFAVRLYSNGKLVKEEEYGLPIRDSLIVGPVPYSNEEYGTKIFSFDPTAEIITSMENLELPPALLLIFAEHNVSLPETSGLFASDAEECWEIRAENNRLLYTLVKEEEKIDVYSPAEPKITLFEGEAAWVTDFEEAKKVGMGLTIDLSDLKDEVKDKVFSEGIDRVVVLGVRNTISSEEDIKRLERLIESHHYTDGFSFLNQGTSTNNTLENRSAYSRQTTDYASSFSLEQTDSSLTKLKEFPELDGSRVASALGTNLEVFAHVPNAISLENSNAEKMLSALWPATWENFLEMTIGNLQSDKLQTLKDHFVKYVRAAGPYPAFRAGKIPYGLLPSSQFSIWEPSTMDSNWLEAPKRSNDQILNQLLTKTVKTLLKEWLSEASELVPKVGGTDPEKDFVEILAMEALSSHLNFRQMVPKEYVNTLIHFVGGYLVSTNRILSRLKIGGSNAELLNWQKEYDKRQDEGWDILRKVLEDLGVPEVNRETLIAGYARYVPWGEGYPADIPSVSISELTYPLPNTSVLNGLLLKSGSITPQIITQLSDLGETELNRLLFETLDLISHRLDAWVTSLATKRLENLRVSKCKGIYIGAFGWLENLKPEPKNSEGGYIHAPSPSHAVTSAVLRSAYMSHLDEKNKNLMAVNLTSARVRQALWILEGIRQGQSLSALLGYQFEKDLHEEYRTGDTPLELDKYIAPFRAFFPLKTEVAKESNQPAETITARNVVDGVALLEAWRNERIPFGRKPTGGDVSLPKSGSNEFKAIKRSLDALDNMLDAVSDLALSESVFQIVRGNFERSGAAIDSFSGIVRPPEIEVAKTPRGGTNVKHRVIAILPKNSDGTETWPETARGRAAPALNSWVGSMLGDPDRIQCRVWYSEENFELVTALNLSLSPLDLLRLSTSSLSGEETELERIIADYVREKHSLNSDAPLRIEFRYTPEAPDDPDSQGFRTFPEIFELCKRIQNVIAHSRCLKTEDLLPVMEAGQSLAGSKASVGSEIGSLIDGKLDSFTIPKFEVTNKEELKKALDPNSDILDGEDENWPMLWLQQSSETHPKLSQFSMMLMLSEALTKGKQNNIIVGQIPYREKDRWLALPLKGNNEEETRKGVLSIVAHIPDGFEGDMTEGLVIDEWDETIPSSSEDTAIAFQFNQPNSEAPNVLLLAVSPKIDGKDGKWQWEHLVGTVIETFDLAKVRTVDPKVLEGKARPLPGVYVQQGVEIE